MLLQPAVGRDVEDVPVVNGEGIGNQLAVTSSPVPLGAHDRRAAVPGERLQPLPAGLELGASHVVGVAAKSRNTPALVRGTAPWAPATAELAPQGLVADPGALECRDQGVDVELGVAAGAGVPANVAQKPHPPATEESDEALRGVGGVANGEDLADPGHASIVVLGGRGRRTARP